MRRPDRGSGTAHADDGDTGAGLGRRLLEGREWLVGEAFLDPGRVLCGGQGEALDGLRRHMGLVRG